MYVADAWDPAQNIEGGARYLRILANQYDGDMVKTLAAYNAGPEAVRRAGGAVPRIPETQEYVRKVVALYQRLQGRTVRPWPGWRAATRSTGSTRSSCFHLNRGLGAARRAARREPATASLERALELRPKDAKVLGLLGQAYYKLSRFDDAARRVAAARGRQPGRGRGAREPRPRLPQGEALRRRGEAARDRARPRPRAQEGDGLPRARAPRVGEPHPRPGVVQEGRLGPDGGPLRRAHRRARRGDGARPAPAAAAARAEAEATPGPRAAADAAARASCAAYRPPAAGEVLGAWAAGAARAAPRRRDVRRRGERASP